jgi:N-acetylneuraminic acid mutarotase
VLTSKSGGKHTWVYRKTARAIAFCLLLAGLCGALPLAGQVTPPSAAVPGDWTWMSGSNTIPVVGGVGQGESGVYGTLGTPASTNVPGGRWGAPNWRDNSGNLWLFGGFGYASNGNFGYLNDLWEFNPSTNYWTWMGGITTTLNANNCGESPTYGTLGTPGGTNVPGGRQSAASWTDKNGNLWLFGGLGDGFGTSSGACGGAFSFGRLNDIWEFNPNLSNSVTGTKGEWAWMGGSSTVPSSGGQPGVYGTTLNTFAPGIFPGARQNASAWTDLSGNFWLFGGEGYDSGGNFGELNDLWEFNPTPGEATSNQWAWMGGSSTVPPYSGNPGVFVMPDQYPGSRYGAASWTDSSGNFWLFGGEGFDGTGNSGNLNDLWEFNPSTNKWAWISGSSTANQFGVYGALGTPNGTVNVPGGRYEAASWIDSSGNLWLSGGQGDGATSSGMLNDLWAFNPPTDQWVWMGGSGTPFLSGVYGTLQSAASGNIPGGRNQATSWTDTYGNFWLFGGDGRANNVNYVGALNDLWVYPPPTICWSPSSSAIQISPATLLADFVGGSYFQNFTATGGCGAGYVWSITSGGTALTNVGLTFSSGGDLSGSATAPGSFPFTVQVTDPRGNSATQNYTLTIYPDITVLPASLPAGTVGTPYSQQLTGGGGAGGPYSFSVASGTALSAVSLTLSPGGLIAGTPSATETAAPLKVQVADSLGDFTQLNYTLTINSASSGPITVNDPETITVNDSATQVQLVDEVSDPETVTVSDIPTVTVTSGPLNITTAASAPAGYVGVPYAPIALFTASGGSTPYTWTATGLPTGLNIASSTGAISGTPTAVGDYLVTVKVTDSLGNSVSAPYPIIVEPALAITTTGPLPTLYFGSTSNLPITFTASGGSGGYSWTVAGQPSGMSMSTVSGAGELSGAPTELGVFTVTVTVQDAAANTNSVIFSLAVASPSLGISASPTALTIVQGQSGYTMLTFTPIGPYSANLTLSCSGLPANSQCTFTTPSGTAVPSPLLVVGAPVIVKLTIETDVSSTLARTESAPTPLRPGTILTAIAFWCPGSLLGLIALRRKRKLFTKNPRSFGLCLFVLLIGTVAGLAGCISGGGFGTYVTPAGTSTVTVVVTPSSGSAQTLNIGVTITQ